MKRIKSACLLQTIHFQLKEDIPHDAAVRAIHDELEHYKSQFARNRTRFQIVEQRDEPDGSIILKLKKQYNSYNCDEYMD